MFKATFDILESGNLHSTITYALNSYDTIVMLVTSDTDSEGVVTIIYNGEPILVDFYASSLDTFNFRFLLMLMRSKITKYHLLSVKETGNIEETLNYIVTKIDEYLKS